MSGRLKTKCGRFAIGYARGGQTHRRRSRQIFGVQRIFVQISSNLPEKKQSKWLQKKDKNDWISFYFGRIFQMKALHAPFLPKFPLTCPTKTKSKKNETVWIFISGTTFVKSKHMKRFCKDFHTICPTFHRFFTDFKGFFPDFHQFRLWREKHCLINFIALVMQ